ncbi:MAG: TonB-dependent receptor, partial [Syntrophales bacterium LBB04]|nr:TonB-dependent receptor [Syntrophales bacterium LBB04]
TPANVTVVAAEEISNTGATSVVQLLEFMEGVQLRNYSGNPAQSMIDLRGFGGDNPYGKTLILLDGRRLNRPDMSAASLMQVPLNNIERIEISRGASSVLYGDAAIGGVINIITRRGQGAPQTNVALTAGSNSYHDEKIGINGSEGNLSYAVNGQNQFSWGYRDHSKLAYSGAGFNLGYDASSYLGLALDGSLSKTSFEMPGGLTKSQMEQNARQVQPGHENDDATEDYQNLHGKINAVLGKWGRLDTDVYYGNKTIKSNFASYWPPNQFNSYNINTLGIAPKYILEQQIAGHTNKLIAGVDCYRETMALDKYENKERTTKTHLVDFEKSTLGFYIRDDFNILPFLILAGGYRHEKAEFKGKSTTLAPYSTDFDTEKKHQAEAWEASLTYLVGQKSNIYVKYASVYRYPFIDEQASFYSSGPFNTFNVNIEREKGKSYEIGTVVSPRENLKIGLTLYRIDMEDEISADPITWELKNLDKTRRVGGEFNFNYAQKGYFRFNGNVTYQKAIFDQGENDGREIPLVPNLMANAALEINLPYNFFLTPKCRYTGSAFLANDYNNNGEKLESYLRWDVYLYWRPEIKGKRIVAFAGAENLTNVKYSTYGIDMSPWGSNLYYPADGMTIKGGISLTF